MIFRVDTQQVVLWLTIEALKEDSSVVLVLQRKVVAETCDSSSQDMNVEVPASRLLSDQYLFPV